MFRPILAAALQLISPRLCAVYFIAACEAVHRCCNEKGSIKVKFCFMIYRRQAFAKPEGICII